MFFAIHFINKGSTESNCIWIFQIQSRGQLLWLSFWASLWFEELIHKDSNKLLVIAFHPPLHPLVCPWLIASDLSKNCEFLSNPWPGNQDGRKSRSSVQAVQRLSAFQRSSRRGYLCWRSNRQCYTCAGPVLAWATGVSCYVLSCFHYCFLLFVSSQWAYLKPSSFVIIPPQLYKEIVFVLLYFLCHLQFPITKVNQSCIDLLDLDLWLSVVLISRVSLFAVHSWLSLSLSLYGLNLYISKCRNKWIVRCLSILDKLVCFRLKLNSKLYNNFLFVFHQH